MIVLGVYSGFGIKDTRSYTVGNRKYSSFLLACTFIATVTGSGATSGNVAEMFKNGLIFLLPISGYILSLILSIAYVFPKFDARFKGMISSGDIISEFYGSAAEKLSGVINTIFCIGIVSVQVIALGWLCQTFFGLKYDNAVAIIGAVIIIYSMFGGIRGVVFTDVLQLIIMVIAMIMIIYFIGHNIEINEIKDNIPVSHIQIIDHPNFFNYFILFLFYAMPTNLLYPPIIQRCLMAKNQQEICNISYVYVVFKVLVVLLLCYIAFALLCLAPSVEPHAIIFYSITEFLPQGFKGIAIIGMISVMMSSADSYLNTASINLTFNTFFTNKANREGNDNPRDARELRILKYNTIVIGIIVIMIAREKYTIFNVLLSINVLLTSTTMPLFMKIIGLSVTPKQFWYNVVFVVISLILSYAFGIEGKFCAFFTLLSSLCGFLITHLIENNMNFKFDNQERGNINN